MAVTRRHYRADDALRVSSFLIENYRDGKADGNWLQPEWEYAQTHPMLDESSLGTNTLWERDGSIVAVVHYEMRLGEAFLELAPGERELLPEMLDCAEVNLRAANEAGRVGLRVYVDERIDDLREIVKARGYARRQDADRPLYEFRCDATMPTQPAPDGFTLRSLADDNDLAKMDRVLWRGFDHPGTPPPESLEGRRKMQSGPNWRADLAIVAVDSSSNYVAYCGVWYVPQCRYAYVEPVTTDPDYRRMGLGRAVVLEGIRRAAADGAVVAYVGSSLPFYQAIGFTRRANAECWFRYFTR